MSVNFGLSVSDRGLIRVREKGKTGKTPLIVQIHAIKSGELWHFSRLLTLAGSYPHPPHAVPKVVNVQTKIEIESKVKGFFFAFVWSVVSSSAN